ncbi:alpha/beta hydrolase [Burkholderia sp. Ac-20365]|jgi:pimeloyl-ACP methyl ester carboxylesterase|uniref:alpha/beta fold hydrolase n=1 Tax=Burkholderia sp. Ac-20365 TaxID=2703897 RepID=UPI00197B8882|nr:alpha/beta hydrolase [Burkholderia sp. Ac-20365]MBN3761961.1 alpha/beta hydrolase [Burkholderia sp. Ac-20365]
MKRLHAIVPLVALLATIIAAPVEAKTVSYQPENACPIVASRPDRIASMREQIAHTPQGDIAYYRFGHGSPIVLQTGFRATVSEWDAAFLTDLAKHHEVIVFDNRGIGRSLPDASSFTVQDMANDLSALIDTLQLRDVTVLGWSMGGAVATQLAIDHPANVQRIVLMSAPAPGRLGVPVPPDVEATLSGRPGTTFNDVMKVLFPPSAAHAAGECFRKNMFVPAGYASPTISATVTAGQTALLRAWEQDNAAAEALRNVHTDTLVLTGADDSILSKQNADVLARALPDAQLLVVRSAGHAMMYQYPQALASAIGHFIAQSPARQMVKAAQ